MHYYLVAPTTRVHRDGIFTYHSEDTFSIGAIVVVEIGKKQSIGVVVGAVSTKPTFNTKAIVRLAHPLSLPLPIIKLAEWLALYYASPFSAVWQTILPRGIGKKRRATKNELSPIARQPRTFTLTTAQKNAVATILNSHITTHVLQGVTGSGKTAVYIDASKHVIDQGKSVIVLVPEIALTSQLIAEFTHHFDTIIVTHSRMTEAERHIAWEKALRSESPCVIIGPRSALFLPVASIGLIVIDEAHEPSFKQEQSPRYSALRAASILAKLHSAKLVLGSATPSISDRYLAEQNDGALIRLDDTAKETGAVDIVLVDSRKRANFTRHRFFSNSLMEAIDKTLGAKQQVLIFHNRRGSASTTLCENCGWTALCPRCHVPEVLHADNFSLLCHICGHSEKVPTQCPVCRHTGVIHKGIGTKLIFDELQRLYPNKKVVRFDKDTTKEDSLEATYQSVYDGDVDIIIGTQIIAKGLDLPHLALVGVVQADGGLSLPDFASSERVFQLLYQVMGRVGRDERLSSIVIQTFQAEHPAIRYALKKDYDGFYEHTLAERRKDHFPPFSYLLKLTCSYKTENSASTAALKLKEELQKRASKTVVFLGPTPAFYERTRDSYRWQLVLRSAKRSDLVELLQHLPTAHWQSELDPVSLL